jgi:hypothetical protein
MAVIRSCDGREITGAARLHPAQGSDAWDFERLNRRYARHPKILGERLGGPLRNDAAAKALLPGRILPSDYLGQRAWRRRVEVLRDASRQLRTFKPE